MAIHAANIVQEYGAYYLNSGQNKSRLLQLLLFGRETTKAVREIKTDDTVYQPAESGITSPGATLPKDMDAQRRYQV
jgi:hypothetical protein